MYIEKGQKIRQKEKDKQSSTNQDGIQKMYIEKGQKIRQKENDKQSWTNHYTDKKEYDIRYLVSSHLSKD